MPRSTNIFPTFWCYTQKNLVCSIAIYNIFVGVAPCPKWLVSPKSQMDCCSPDPHDHQISPDFPHRRVRGAILLKAAASVSILVHGLQAARFRDGDSGRTFSSEMGPNFRVTFDFQGDVIGLKHFEPDFG